ncbi:hypothetical protein K402DRAFT_235485 [Aulographum hederae CBS 113979]|uniref:DNA-directed RNA polymerase subunit n=1 Tax=Aulographum hederae CBS 113979 TaxID=1176131 RepID=A0A6G1GKI7_9PEZI|nr:hypothetical protein K402DRAFT_235485 [Aulographum hederae CBS 113979]
MFNIAVIEDLVEIPPVEFTRKTRDVVEDQINAKYCNKIVQNVGLCIRFYDLLTASDGLITPGKGTVHVIVKFRLLVFRPHIGEILEGTIAENGPEGIFIHVNFFIDIFVPAPTNLFEDCTYLREENVWTWGEGEDAVYFDVGERCRFRVETEQWNFAHSKTGSQQAELEHNALSRFRANFQGNTEVVANEPSGVTKKLKRSPYVVIASMQQPGLGCRLWWEAEDDEPEQEPGATE